MTKYNVKYHRGIETWRETVTTPLPYFVTPSARVFGIDVSRYQDDYLGNNTINYEQCFQDGVKFAAIRCTVGDYYTDPRFEEHWDGFRNAGILCTPYLVVAPAWSPVYGYHPVGPNAHWDYFMRTFGERNPDLPIVLDCELDRDMPPDYISDLIVDIAHTVNDNFGRYPIIYARGEWWNKYTTTRATFANCDLWIARYNETIDHPWEDDDRLKPRDWDDWDFWQWSKEHEIDGIPDSKVDADSFNGTLEDLLSYADGKIENPVPTPEPTEPLYSARVVNCSQLRIRDGWNYPAYMSEHIGSLFNGAVVGVYEEHETADGICCRISGNDAWAWRHYSGVEYLEII